MNFREVRENKHQIFNYIRYFSKIKEVYDNFITSFTSYLSSQVDFPVKTYEKHDNGISIKVFLDNIDIYMDYIEYNMDIWGKLVVTLNISHDKKEELFILYFNDDGQVYDSLEEVRPKTSLGNSYFSETFLLVIYQAMLSRHSYSKMRSEGMECGKSL